MLFDNEFLNISKLNRVIFYEPLNSNNHTYKPVLPTYEIMYYIKGETTVQFGNKTFDMTPDSVLYLPKGTKNDIYTVKVKEKFAVYNIYFDSPDILPNEAIKISVKSNEIKTLFEKLYRTWFAKKDGYYYKSMGYTYNIIGLLRKQQLSYIPKSKFSRLSPSEDYMRLHYCDRKFNYNKLINLSGLSYSYFKKLFIDKYGIPPVKYITKLKIDRACELLATEKFSISEIAEICGFENSYYFSTVFKKQMGVSPKNYLKI